MPLCYLGVPIFQDREKMIYFENMINKVQCLIDRWLSRLLSEGGKMILVNHVLGSIPIYTFSDYSVPNMPFLSWKVASPFSFGDPSKEKPKRN